MGSGEGGAFPGDAMTQTIAGIDFAPVLPLWLLGAAALLAVLALAPAAWRRARGTLWRAVTFALVLLALANPRLVEESRETRPDIALLVVDRSDSTTVGTRTAQIEAARREIEARAGRLPELELRTAEVPEGGNQGTRLFAATPARDLLAVAPATPAGEKALRRWLEHCATLALDHSMNTTVYSWEETSWRRVDELPRGS